MDDHSRRVEDAAETRPPGGTELRQHPVDERPRVATRPDLRPGPLQDDPRRGNRQLVRLGGEPLVGEQAVHGRQVAQPHRLEV